MERMRLKFLLILVIFVGLFLSIAYAQSQLEAETQARGSGQEEGGIRESYISIDFKEADIRDVLRILSRKSGVDIIASDDVQALVTVKLTNVPWEKALEVILKNYGFVYERKENIIRVTTVEQLTQEQPVTEVFTLNYSQAAEVAESIREMISARGRLKTDPRTNQLVITDIPTNLYNIRKVVERLDRRTPQVRIEAKVIETTLVEDEKLGIDWTLKVTGTGAVRPWAMPFDVGSDYRGPGKTFFPEHASTDTTFPSTPANTFPYVTSGFTFGTLDFHEFQAVLEVLKSRSDTDIISNPRITTLNNKEAVIYVGSTFNIPLYERNDSTGAMQITGYTAEDVGVKLTVTPHVNARGEIVVELHPEVSSFVTWDTFGNVIAPRFSVREATTEVMINDGETIVIGGLIKEEIVKTRKKVPLLGDIPIIGWLLFRKKVDTVNKTDLLFFVTVYLVKDNITQVESQQVEQQ